MPSVTGLTAARMLEIEAKSIVNARLENHDLILVKHDGTEVNVGDVRGPVGPAGPQMPPGSVISTAAAAAPTGWLLCDGSEVGRLLYADLFAAIGTQYGNGDGTTTFNVPDLRGRTPFGLDNMGGSDAGRLTVPNTRGGSGGAEKHTLSTSEMPAHTHGDGSLATSSAGSHQHQAAWSKVDGVYHELPNYGYAPFSGNKVTWGDAAGAHTHTITGSTSSAGSGSSHNNMPPYLLLNMIIKT